MRLIWQDMLMTIKIITEHQKMLASDIGFDRENWVFPIQTHENKVAKITQDHKG